MMKRLLCVIFLTVWAVTGSAIGMSDIPNVHIADSTQFVSNPSGVLSQSAVRTIDSTLRSLKSKTSAEVAVVVIDHIDETYDIDRFATGLFESWGIGKKDNDNGVLVVVSRDDREAVIRTGYGVEGVLPDILCARIMREKMFPAFKQGNYDLGVYNGVNEIARILSNPDYADEVRSNATNEAARVDNSGDVLFDGILMLAYVFGIGAFIWVIIVRIRAKRKYKDDEVSRWRELRKHNVLLYILSFVSLGFALPALLLLLWSEWRVRKHTRKCQRCGRKMLLLDEHADNEHLNAGQNLEERLNSVDYDVWLCPECSYKDILPYVNPESTYKECPNCHVRAMNVIERKTVVPATTKAEGEGIDKWYCQNCGHSQQTRFRIPKKADTDALAAMAAAAAMANRRNRHGRSGGFGGFGGGFGGGSFGGGRTGGGGARGGW